MSFITKDDLPPSYQPSELGRRLYCLDLVEEKEKDNEVEEEDKKEEDQTTTKEEKEESLCLVS